MTTYEALSIVAQFSLVLLGAITLVITIIVVLDKKK